MLRLHYGDVKYITPADFSYFRRESSFITYEDAKGMRTDVYKLKRKLVKVCTGIEIIEV